MSWALVIGFAAWLVLAVLLALLIGRSVRMADAHEVARGSLDDLNFVVDPGPASRGPSAAEVTLRESQRPLHPPTSRDRSTIPGLPVARPAAARPDADRRRTAGNPFVEGHGHRHRRSQSG